MNVFFYANFVNSWIRRPEKLERKLEIEQLLKSANLCYEKWDTFLAKLQNFGCTAASSYKNQVLLVFQTQQLPWQRECFDALVLGTQPRRAAHLLGHLPPNHEHARGWHQPEVPPGLLHHFTRGTRHLPGSAEGTHGGPREEVTHGGRHFRRGPFDFLRSGVATLRRR